MSLVVMVLCGGVGALVRAEVTEREGTRRGVAVVNLTGAFLLGLVVGLVGGVDADSLWLAAAAGGFGGLTTYSTWLYDTSERPSSMQAPALVVTLGVGVLLAGLGWFLGAAIS